MLRRSPRRKYVTPSSSEKPKIFQCEQHAKIISTKQQTFCKRKKCIDIVLFAEFDNYKVYTHRDVLSASSDYFRAMFHSSMSEATADSIMIKEIDGVTLKLITDFMYTAEIELLCTTVERVLRAADFFQMHTLVAGCCHFLGEHLDASNCLGITLFAQQHSYIDLHMKSSEWICNHWELMCKESEFLQLSEEQLITFILNTDLNLLSEEKLFFGLVTWLEYDRRNREVYCVKLMSLIRFPLLEPKFIIENRHWVCKTIESYDLIFIWLHWHLSPKIRSSQFLAEMPRLRKPKRKLTFINCYADEDFCVQTYNPELDTWSHENLPLPTREMFLYRPWLINGKRLASKHLIDYKYLEILQYIDRMKVFHRYRDSASVRSFTTVAKLLKGDNMYVVRRRENTWDRAIHSVEKYNFSAKRWEIMEPLQSAYTCSETAVLGGRLYHLGEFYKTLECYNFKTNKWTRKSSRNVESKTFGIVALGGYLYAVGGTANGNKIRAVERFDPATNSWTEIAPLEKAMERTSCCVFNGRLIVFGRTDDGTGVAEYNPITNKWKTLASVLPFSSPYDYYKLFVMQA